LKFYIIVRYDDYHIRPNKHKAGINETGTINVLPRSNYGQNDVFPLNNLEIISTGGASLELLDEDKDIPGGFAKFQASYTPGAVTIKVTDINNDIGTYAITVVKPSGVKIDIISGIRHTQGIPSCGFWGKAYLQPSDVSFNGLQVKEGTVRAVATGYFAHLNEEMHPESDNWVDVITVRPGWGSIGGEDQILFESENYTPYVNGRYTWPIPWYYKDAGGLPELFTVCNYEATIEPIDDTAMVTLKKGGAEAQKRVNEPTSSY